MQQLINQLFMDAFNNPWLAEQEDQARISLYPHRSGRQAGVFYRQLRYRSTVLLPAVISASWPSAVQQTMWRSAAQFRAFSPAALSLKKGCPGHPEGRCRQHGIHGTGSRDRHRDRDTKVVQRGAADKLFINTAGMGAIPADIHWGAGQLTPGDVLLVSGTLGCHGATILNLREGLGLDGELRSDCAVLTAYSDPAFMSGVKALRDATRGGVNAVVHEFAASSG
jgi:hydrogenase expression/formation protein HypE